MGQFQERILERIIKGESPLTVAQEMNLTERQLTEVLREANKIQVEFLKQDAETLQQINYQRLEKMYNFAIEQAMAEYDEGTEKNPRTVRGHLGWFDAALRVLSQQNMIVKPYLGQQETKGGDIFVTVIGGTVAFEKAKHLSHMVGRDIFEVIEGQIEDLK